VVRRDLIARIPANTRADLADLMRDATAEGLVAGCELRDRFWEIGRPGPLEAFRAFVRDRAARPRKAVFLDRDGTINEAVRGGAEAVDSPFRPEDVRLIPGAADALRRMKSLGYMLIVVTNQPGATKGKATVPDLWRVDDRVRDLLAAEGVAIDDSLVCPHHPAGVPDRCRDPGLIGPCACRKPAPGLIRTAAAKHGIDLAASFMVGDSDADMGAAEAAGVRAVRVGPKGGTLSEFADRLLEREA
jgi:D-glycero-D-manno-heptose 1,7-bisphosphate phosphatase